MEILKDGKYTGERALYDSKNLHLINAYFYDGESPLKESESLLIEDSTFQWKYPLWYCNHVTCNRVTLLETARSGIWYTNDISFKDSTIIAPKTFRRASGITLMNVEMPNAQESLWNCSTVSLMNVKANGDYFLMNVNNCVVSNLHLDGNYAFDGGKNIIIKNSVLNSKDSFWNCENVTIENSTIIGEYLGWNSRNLTFINCDIESLQGLCYIEGLKMVNCRLTNTNLCFEFCEAVDAEINSHIDSVKNPFSGSIRAKSIGEIILDPKYVDLDKVEVKVEE